MCITMKWLLMSLLIAVSAVSALPLLEENKQGIRDEAPECLACEAQVRIIYPILQANKTVEDLIEALIPNCVATGNGNEQICRDLAGKSAPEYYYIYQHSNVTEGNICGLVQSRHNCSMSDPESLEWTVKLSNVTKPTVVDPVVPQDNIPVLQVLHLADLHWDPEYAVGTWAVCQEPLCCRLESTSFSTNQSDGDKAGYWGDYRFCDLPKQTLIQALDHISSTHPNIDYIVWTGDTIPHNKWSTTREGNLAVFDETIDLLRTYFPNIPVYPTLGNHEADPADSYSPPGVEPEFSTSWLYDDADTKWSLWLPAETHETIRLGGYYTTLVRPGLRIISMNNNYCYSNNRWILYESKDPASGLAWMNQVLEEAEKDGEKVHIIGHISPGDMDCWRIFGREYTKIVNRFENTVTAQFYGHTHKDEFEVFYDEINSTRATNIAYIGPSLTTFVGLNPGYRLYKVEGDYTNSTFSVVDHSTWIMNLTQANLTPDQVPLWYELYEAKTAYNMAGLRPQDWSDLVQRMTSEDSVFELFYNYHVKASEVELEKGCDSQCKNEVLCNLVTSSRANVDHCLQVRQLTKV